MGSGTNRKPTDSPIIRKPKDATINSGGGQGDESSSPEKIADMCIPSFDVKISETAMLVGRESVSLQKGKSDTYTVMLFGQKIAEVSKKLSIMVTKCEMMGVRYPGKVVKKKDTDEFFARFIRE